jgi:hypothetical protein
MIPFVSIITCATDKKKRKGRCEGGEVDLLLLMMMERQVKGLG